MDFSGKNAIITGGCGVIGKNLAKELLRNGVQSIGLFDIVDNPTDVINFLKTEFLDRTIKFYKTNVRDKSSLLDSFKSFKNDFEYIDIVIACAGIINEHDVEQMVELNLIGAINTMLIGMDEMSISKSGRGGLIVGVASTAATEFLPYISSYSATKHGVLAFTRSMGNDINMKNHGVRFVTICPGRTDSKLCSVDNYENMYLPDYIAEASGTRDHLPKQQPETLAKLAIKPFAIGENGSVWVIAEGKYKKYVPPKTEDM